MSVLGQFQFRRDTSIRWAAVDPVLLDGELGIESDTDLFKLGDGATAWNLLPYGGVKGDTGDTGLAAIAFTNIAVAGQSTVSAEAANDTLTIVGAGSVSITTDAATDTITISGAATPPQNAFSAVTGNTGTATADSPSDTIAITGGAGISTVATDTPDGLVVNNTDRGTTAVAAHVGEADPHTQYWRSAGISGANAQVIYVQANDPGAVPDGSIWIQL